MFLQAGHSKGLDITSKGLGRAQISLCNVNPLLHKGLHSDAAEAQNLSKQRQNEDFIRPTEGQSLNFWEHFSIQVFEECVCIAISVGGSVCVCSMYTHTDA